MRTKLDRFGLEIEGEFSDKLLEKLQEVGIIKSDNSVYSCRGGLHTNLSCAEFNSRPYEITELSTAKEEVFALLEKYYEKKEFHFNKTCGFHIHISFRPQRPPEMLSSQFANYFLAELKKEMGGVLKRRKDNNYCNADFIDDKYIARPIDRYKAINYCALTKFKTIEFRIFPANKPKVMLYFLEFTLDRIKKFLAKPLKIDFCIDADEELSEKINELEEVNVALNHESIEEINQEIKIKVADELEI